MRTLRWAVLLAVAAVLAVPGAASAQGQGVEFLVQPSPGSSTAAQGGYFLLDARPGDVITQSVDVRNDSTQPLELQLAPVDAVTGSLGGASYGLGGDEATRTGAWVDLDRTSLTLEPGASAVVPFTVTVPADARTGEHLAGISVSPPRDSRAPGADGGDAGVSVDVQTRRVVAVQVNLPGEATPELLIEGVTAAARPDGLYLEITIAHTGTALTKGTGVITVPDDDFEREFSIDTFVPDTSIAYPVQWSPDAPDGEHPAQVEVRYGDQVARWDGTVNVGEQVLDDLADRQVDPPDAAAAGSLPLVVLAVLATAALALAVLGGFVVIRLRQPVAGRRHQDRASAPAR